MKQLIFSLLAAMLALGACRSDYEKMLAEERASGAKHDELWLGFRFGTPQKIFFDTCWQLNGRGVLSHGTELPITTRMDVSQHFSAPVFMNFYPTFEDGQIAEMMAIFVYKDWSPWMNELNQEKLLAESARYLEKLLPGNAFIQIKHPEKGKVLVKVDGNRQVLLFPFQEQKAKALITDLNRKK